MDTNKIAGRLVELCRTGQYQKAQAELYSNDAESVEPQGSHWGTVKGMDKIKEKAVQWGEMVEEVHSTEVSDPVIAGNRFSVAMKNEVTMKGMGRQKIEEVAMYEVKNGKIIREQFFYDMEPPK